MSVEKEFNAEGHDDSLLEAGSENPLANLSDEKEVGVQLDKVKRMTVEPGLLKLPVQSVDANPENEKLSIELFHPVDENPVFFVPKPTFWDKEEEPLPRLMDWYGYKGSNYHQLQTDKLYIRKGNVRGESLGVNRVGGDSGSDWAIVPPPEWSPPRWERFKRGLGQKTRALRRPSLIMAGFFLLQFAAVTGLLALLFGASTLWAATLGGGFALFSLWLYGVAVAFKESV